MRDHMLNWQLPAQPLGPAIRKQSKPAVWPFPLPPKSPTFVADCRTMDSDRPKREEPAKPAENIAEACFGVWRKTPPQPNVELKFRSPWTGEIKSRWPGPQSGWADGWEWFDTSAEPEKPAQAEPQATPQPDAEGWTPYSGQRCPLPMGTRYECERANGRRSTYRVDSGDFDPGSFWNHAPDDSERNRASWLVRYRVLVDA